MIYFTVRQKLGAIAFLTSLSLSGLFAIQYRNTHETTHIVANLRIVEQRAETMSALRNTVKELNLDAMDVIVDKADGYISAERSKDISEKMDFMEAQKQALAEIAQQANTPELINTFNAQIETLRKLLQQDLPNAVQAFGKDVGNENFAALDDAIDGISVNMVASLDKGILAMRETMKAQFQHANDTAKQSLIMAITIFLGTLVAQLLVIWLLSRGIVRSINRLIHRFEEQTKQVFSGFSDTSAEMHATATALTQSASQTSEQSTALFSTSETTHLNMHNVAAASEELYSTTDEIKRVIIESVKIVQEAMVQAQATTETMNQMFMSANEVKETIALVSSIAEKTNLLALNASIEAMRAGELGKGFSVVASEVKILATQTTSATRQITDKVMDIQGISGKAVTAINDIQATINKINDIASVISSAVEEQGASTQEISRNCNEVASGSKLITDNIKALQNVAGEADTASQDVLKAIDAIEEQTRCMKHNIETFVKGLRAA
jgi:methyl-accepting chemotaxis protein